LKVIKKLVVNNSSCSFSAHRKYTTTAITILSTCLIHLSFQQYMAYWRLRTLSMW